MSELICIWIEQAAADVSFNSGIKTFSGNKAGIILLVLPKNLKFTRTLSSSFHLKGQQNHLYRCLNIITLSLSDVQLLKAEDHLSCELLSLLLVVQYSTRRWRTNLSSCIRSLEKCLNLPIICNLGEIEGVDAFKSILQLRFPCVWVCCYEKEARGS